MVGSSNTICRLFACSAGVIALLGGCCTRGVGAVSPSATVVCDTIVADEVDCDCVSFERCAARKVAASTYFGLGCH